MPYRSSARLIPLSTLLVGSMFFALAALTFGFGFLEYVHSLSHDSETLLDEIVTAVGKSRDRTASGAAQLMAPRLFRRELLMTFVDQRSRVTVFHRASDSRHAPPVILVRLANDRSGTPTTSGLMARLVLGSAAICGLDILRANVNDIAISVSENDPVFVERIRAYGPLLAASCIGIVLLTIGAGALFNRSALQPLLDVTNALERLALGDFTMHLVESGRDGQLGALARSYNGAVARVKEAFTERDGANAAMRRFVADAGHQLRTPLTVIRGFISILAQPSMQARSADTEHMLRVMDEQSSLMASLIDNLILLDRWEFDNPLATRPVDVLRLTEDIVVSTGDAQITREILFRRPPANEILVGADPSELTYAVTNVLDNALSYTNGQVRIAIDVDAASVAIVVSDDGPGMPPEVLERACDRFYRGQRRDVAGSGLGLAIAKRAIERAGGSVTVESAVDRGTDVTMRLPRLIAQQIVPAESRAED